MSSPISAANISFVDGIPYADDYDDHYFSKDGGIAESQHVFLDGNHIAKRFASLTTSFHIVETGFGTGLNFLLTWQQFLHHAPANTRLYFTSIERHPLSKPDLETALAFFPSLSQFTEQLVSLWPHLSQGMHRLQFGRVVLTLCFDDVEDAMPELASPVDAWYLDGFAPSKNPQMWQPYLYRNMARLSKPYATASSFTSSNTVRRGLQRQGFTVDNTKGFGRKHFMTQAVFNASNGPLRPQPVKHYWSQIKQEPTGKIAIIGAGIAGIQTAYALAQKGIACTVFDGGEALCAGASGNRQGALYFRPSVDISQLAAWQATAYQFANRQLAGLPLSQDDYQQCGVLQLPLNDKDARRQARIAAGHALYPSSMVTHISARQASELANTPIESTGLLFNDGAWVFPKAWMQALIQSPLIELALNHTLQALVRTDKAWQLSFTNGKEGTFDQVIICNGWQASEWVTDLQIKPIRGQVTRCQTSIDTQVVVCSERYLTPALSNGEQHFGATYDLGSSHCDVTEADHRENVAQLEQRFGALNLTITGGRSSVRATTPDTLPYCGQVSAATFPDWVKAKQRQRLPVIDLPPTESGLYVNSGHGSRGLATSALAGELIACMITNDPLPVGQSMLAALHPSRTLYKKTIKGQ